MNATRTAAVAVIAAGLATTSCAAGGRTPMTVITVAPAPVTTPDDAAPPVTLDVPLDVDTTNSDDPAGTPVEFAIRYLNRLHVECSCEAGVRRGPRVLRCCSSRLCVPSGRLSPFACLPRFPPRPCPRSCGCSFY